MLELRRRKQGRGCMYQSELWYSLALALVRLTRAGLGDVSSGRLIRPGAAFAKLSRAGRQRRRRKGVKSMVMEIMLLFGVNFVLLKSSAKGKLEMGIQQE